jgi:hypothetical protein
MDLGDHRLTASNDPSALGGLGNAAAAAGRAVRAAVTGQPVFVAESAKAARLALCAACPEFKPDAGRCAVCGCRMAYKASLATERCPLEPPKW